MTTLEQLPAPVAAVARTLEALPGALAVVLGGSRGFDGSDSVDGGSDWDLAVYYRDHIELDALATYGEVYPPGAWGRLMNGGGWLCVDGVEIDVILRNLDVAQHWTRRAEEGEWELDALLGYLAGLPTYSLAAELASGRVLAGMLPVVDVVPPRLIESAPPRWRFSRDFSLDYARMHAARGNAIGAAGQVAKAAMEEAHARVCERGQWVLNEKRLLSAAGLDAVGTRFSALPADASALTVWVDTVADELTA